MNKTLILASIFVIFFLLEKAFPLRQRKKPIWGRSLNNLLMSLFTYASAFLLVIPATHLANNTAGGSFGVLNWLPAPAIVKVVVGFLIFDLCFYYWHWANHKVPVMWRFHNVHHYDVDLDVTTSFRFHFMEVGYSAVFRFLQFMLVGAPLELFGIYEVIFQAATFFHHSNWKLPYGLEKMISYVFVTPRVHGIHHSQVQTETDSNYAVIFSIWDRIHRTFVGAVKQNEINNGVPGYAADEDQSLQKMLLSPLRPQKNYWATNQIRNTRPSPVFGPIFR